MVEKYLKKLEVELEHKDEEIERLNNILNELEKWLDDNINKLKFEDDYDSADTLKIVLDKIKELKGSDKE